MPRPHEEMRTVHDSLTANNRDRLYKTEAKEHWLESGPGRTNSDYMEFAKSGDRFVVWRDELMSSLETNRARSKTEESVAGTIGSVEYHKLDSRPRDSFADREALRAYDGLAGRFEDADLADYNSRSVYKFDTDSMIAFGTLLGEAKAGAQRNATELATYLATAMALAGEEVSRTETGSRSDWEDSDLYDTLEGLKTALQDWNALLAESALPDERALRDRAKQCSDELSSCARAHERLMTSGGKEAVPFVKYQLLATMRAIGEKVAAQYVARAGKASYSALYELTRDVPNRGPDDQAARERVERYQGDPAKALARELATLERDLLKEDKKTSQKLKSELLKTPLGLSDALTFWHDNFAKLAPLKNNREELRKKVAQVAFGVRRFKETVDAVFAQHDLADGSPTAKALKGIRDRYQQTFDGVAQMLNQDIVQCVQTLR
jgi:hypothetical protein